MVRNDTHRRHDLAYFFFLTLLHRPLPVPEAARGGAGDNQVFACALVCQRQCPLTGPECDGFVRRPLCQDRCASGGSTAAPAAHAILSARAQRRPVRSPVLRTVEKRNRISLTCRFVEFLKVPSALGSAPQWLEYQFLHETYGYRVYPHGFSAGVSYLVGQENTYA